MASKVFVSYKYDESRNFVDEIERKFSNGNNIYKGEQNGNDLSYLSDDSIKRQLKEKIFDTTVTIVLISPKINNSKWVPWEISYSLQEVQKSDGRSRTNGVIAVVIPGQNNYKWAIDDLGNWNLSFFPELIEKNINNGSAGESYIDIVKWDTFIVNYNYYIQKAKNKNPNQFKLTKYNE